MIHVYTGDGKGKTTAAFGLAMRAAGRGKKVAVVQFLKNGDSGEVLSAKKLGIDVYTSALDKVPWDRDAQDEWSGDTVKRFELAKTLAQECELLVCDELISVVGKGFISQEAVLEFANACRDIELVLTGRNAPESMIDCADLVTEMKCIKHYFEEGIQAREGIEY